MAVVIGEAEVVAVRVKMVEVVVISKVAAVVNSEVVVVVEMVKAAQMVYLSPPQRASRY